MQPDRATVTMPPEAVSILNSMYANEAQLGTDGQIHAIDTCTRIYPQAGLFLKQVHQAIRPMLSVEVGLAYGFSTAYILSAMKEGGYGQHIAIDPHQTTQWHGIGAQNVAKMGMKACFRLMEESSAAALPKLSDEGRERKSSSSTGITNLTTCSWISISPTKSVS